MLKKGYLDPRGGICGSEERLPGREERLSGREVKRLCGREDAVLPQSSVLLMQFSLPAFTSGLPEATINKFQNLILVPANNH